MLPSARSFSRSYNYIIARRIVVRVRRVCYGLINPLRNEFAINLCKHKKPRCLHAKVSRTAELMGKNEADSKPELPESFLMLAALSQIYCHLISVGKH